MELALSSIPGEESPRVGEAGNEDGEELPLGNEMESRVVCHGLVCGITFFLCWWRRAPQKKRARGWVFPKVGLGRKGSSRVPCEKGYPFVPQIRTASP